ncbi:S8 family serine peptidase [Streptomyces sp. NPDC098781]|uniref:S8 family serine peptidase n=1 Tax=Streptomyces sp. NPDC098781 TaxID=3366097 RepID=UPI0038300897
MRPALSRLVRAAVATALCAVAPVGVPSGAAAAEGPVALPAVKSRLEDGESCAKESGTKAVDQPWTRQALGLDRSWQLSMGADVTVAVLDTGVGNDVPGLSGRVASVDGAGSTADCVGHGSFAAGLIAAEPIGGTGVVGVAPRARILAVPVTGESGDTTPQLVAQGIRRAVDAGADVVYVAHAFRGGREELTAAVEHATERDVLVVAPAAPDVAPTDPGTGQPDPIARPYFPAFIPQVLSVMDHGPGGARPESAPEAFAPDLSAPGDEVVSVGPRGAGHYIGSGSSLAAAGAAGAAALVRDRYPELTVAEVSRRLQGAAYPASVPVLDPFAALSIVLPAQQAPLPGPGRARVAKATPEGPRVRALAIAGGFGALVLLVAAAAVVIPRGRARSWRPAGQ